MGDKMTDGDPAQLAISPVDLGKLGLNQVAFIKPVVEEDGAHFVVHAADGTAVHTFATRELAELAIRQHDLQALSVH
ncbi:MAG: DUF1150 domain-containing protein [bacterium]|nr:DUF1150 domain-containing protein [bacterium]